MNKAKNILIITPGFPNGTSDENCIPALQEYIYALNNLAAYNIEVISMQYPDSKTYNWHGVKVHSLGGGNAKGIKKLLLWKLAVKTCKSIISSKQIDVIHAFWGTEATHIAMVLNKRYGTPFISTFMGQEAKSPPWYIKGKVIKHGVVLSSYHKNALKHKVDTLHLIPWGVKKTSIISDKSLDVVGVGSLIPVKDWPRFIRIASDLNARTKSKLSIQLIGGGPELENLMKINKQYGSPVDFLGEISRSKTLELIAQSKVLLHTSRYESFGLVMAEALSLNTNVVSTKVGYAEDSNNIKTFTTDTEAVEFISDMLGSEQKKLTFPEITDTVNSYINLYHRVSND